MGTMEVAGGSSFWNLSQPDLPVAPYNILSKYGPVSLKHSFRTYMPESYGQYLCAGSGPSSLPLSKSREKEDVTPKSSVGRILRLVGWIERTREPNAISLPNNNLALEGCEIPVPSNGAFP